MHMGMDTVEAILNFVRRKASQLEHLDISWFGGEPLLNLKAVRALSSGFRAICEADNIALQGFMSTNASLLTAELLTELVHSGISRYQITFDGSEEAHNRQRLAANGKPTYETLWANLCSFQELTITFEALVRVHVTPSTIQEAREFLGVLREQFGRDTRFKVAVANVSHWGGPNDHQIPVFSDPSATLRTLAGEIAPANQIIQTNAVCSAASPFDLVIRPNGTVVKCAHSLDLDENQLGHLTQEGQFVYRSGSIDAWLRGMVNGDHRALQCPRDGIEGLSPVSRLVTLRRHKDAHS